MFVKGTGYTEVSPARGGTQKTMNVGGPVDLTVEELAKSLEAQSVPKRVSSPGQRSGGRKKVQSDLAVTR